jgi:MFS family permease
LSGGRQQGLGAGVRVRIFYGWIIAGVVCLSWAISVGPRQAFSVFLPALLTEFGSSRTAISAAFSVHMAAYALGGWALGGLVDRQGPRRVIAWCTATWAITLLLSGLTQTLWQLYLIYGVVGGVATSGLAYVSNNTLLSRWFIRYRGAAMGISQAGVPLGAAVFGALSQVGVEWYGWRWTHIGFGLVVAATALPLVIGFIRDDPREKGLAPDGTPPEGEGPWGAGSRTPPLEARGFTGSGIPRGYWPVFGANVLRGMTMYAILVHQVVYLVDAGFPKMAAASLFSLGSLVAVPAGLAAGAISDRVGRPRAYAGIAGLYVIAYLSLLLVRDPSRIVPLGLFVLAWGMATGGGSPVFAAFLSDRLQGPRLGYLLGLQNIGFGIGATVGPLLAAALFDLLGGYAAAFVLMTASMITSSVIVSAAARRLPGLSR